MLQDTTLAKILSISKIFAHIKWGYFLISLTFYAYFRAVCVINQCKIVTGMPENIATTRNETWELAERSQYSA
jgi:bacteriorhodopsin